MAATHLAVGCTALLVILLSLALTEAASSTDKQQPQKRGDGYGYGHGEGQGKPKFATRCLDRNSPCYHVRRSLCPRRCPGNCYIDCKTCGTRCNKPSHPPPPPPTETPYSPPPTVTPPPPPTETPYPPPPTVTPPPPPTVTPSPPPTETPPPPPTETPSPPPASSGVKKVRCKNKRYPTCYFKEFTCPASCPQSCEIDCVTCRPVCNCDKPGTVCQDPKFVGADGITFYFHGKKDHDFCLVTDPNLHINGRFIGKRNEGMQRDFTWVQSLGILFNNHTLFIGAEKTGIWNDAVDRLDLTFDDQPVYLSEGEGASWKSSTGDLIITRSEKTNTVVIDAKDNFKIRAKVVPITQTESLIHNYGITDEDCFAHLDLSFRFSSLTHEVNGVLGQTYAGGYVSRVNMGAEMPVLGGNKEFSSSSLFSTDCQVSRFMGKNVDHVLSTDGRGFADLSCTATSGAVVCKR